MIVRIDHEAESRAYFSGFEDGLTAAQEEAEDDEEPTEEDDDPL